MGLRKKQSKKWEKIKKDFSVIDAKGKENCVVGGLKYFLNIPLKRIRRSLLVFGYLSRSNVGGAKGTEH